MDEAFVENAYRQMGEYVYNIKIIRKDPSLGKNSYCFVQMADAETARTAMLRLNGKLIPGTNPPVRFKLNQAGHGKDTLFTKEYSIFVGELASTVDDYALYNAFASRYPSCHGAKVVFNEMTGDSRGYGFVRFSDETEQKQAIIEMQNVDLNGKRINVSLAIPRKSVGKYYNYGQQNNQQQQQPYQQYMNSQYYQQQQQYGQGYNYAGYGYDQSGWWSQSQNWHNQGYGQGAYQQPQATQAQTAEAQTTEAENTIELSDDEALEDPCLEIDVEQANKEFMEQSEELYTAMEESRWNSMDTMTTIIAAKS